MGIGLAQQILGLMDLVGCIDCYQNCPDLNCSPEGDKPLGHIGGPYGYMVAGLDAQRYQGTGKGIHIVPEFRIGPGVIMGDVPECILIREFINHAVQHLGQGKVDEGVFLPDIMPCTCVIGIQAASAGILFQIPGHVIGKIREYNAGVIQVGSPSLDPFKGYVTVVVDGPQGQHKIIYGEIPLAHHAIRDLAVFHDRILNMDVFDIGAKVLDGLAGGFVCEPVGMMDIPKGSYRLASHRVKQVEKPAGIGINTVCFHKKGYTLFRGDGSQLFQGRNNNPVVHLSHGLGFQVRQDTDIRGFKLCGQFYILDDFIMVLFSLFGKLQAAARRKAGYLQV